MRRADAPPAGWYPDPTSRSQLRWWDGLDWTDHRRVAGIVASELQQEGAVQQHDEQDGEGTRRRHGSSTSMNRDEVTAVVAEARRAAREEADRAIDKLSDRARDATRRLEPLIGQYGDRAMRWIRNLFIVVVVLVVLWMVLQTVGQASLVDWIGDRVDSLFSTEG